MIQIYNCIDRLDLYQWNKLTETSSNTSFFQTKECYDFYASLSFMEPFVFAVSENNILKGVVVGYIQKDGGRLKQFFSRRAINSASDIPLNSVPHPMGIISINLT